MATIKEIIAKRAARELKDGDIVNLGIGLPTLLGNYLEEGVGITLQAENGILGMGSLCEPGQEDKDIVNAGMQYVNIEKGACFFDSATSFGIIRGGHVDVTVLGALEIDETGTLASHIIPGKMVPGMGGAMDLVVGAKKVIVVTTHTAKGAPKILKKVRLPITAVGKVDMIITELAVIEVTPEGLLLKEISADTTVAEVKNLTEAELIVSEDLIIGF